MTEPLPQWDPPPEDPFVEHTYWEACPTCNEEGGSCLTCLGLGYIPHACDNGEDNESNDDGGTPVLA